MHRGDDCFLILAAHHYVFSDANHSTNLMVTLLNDWCVICPTAVPFAALACLF
jgi:hypothetical protein